MTGFKIIGLCLFVPLAIYGQQEGFSDTTFRIKDYRQQVLDNQHILKIPFFFPTSDSVFYFLHLSSGICKLRLISLDRLKLQNASVVNPSANTSPQLNERWLQAHGNVTYDFFYRSATDTPYAERNIVQHTISTLIYATIKNNIPIIIQLNARQGNSYLFRNYIDGSVEFDGQSYQSLMKQNLIEKMKAVLSEQSAEKLLQSALQENYRYQQQLQTWLQDGKQLQQLIESRQMVNGILLDEDWSSILKREGGRGELMDRIEQTYIQKEQVAKLQDRLQQAGKFKSLTSNGYASEISGLRSNTVLTESVGRAVDFLKEYAEKEELFNRYEKKRDSLEQKFKAEKAVLEQRTDSIKYLIQQTNDPSILRERMKEYGADSLSSYIWLHRLMAIKRLAIGRSRVDYSELTAKNINVTGVNLVYSNRIYFAFSGGTVDYHYRNFMSQRKQQISQYLLLAQLGIGDTNESGFTTTVFGGRKQSTWINSNNSQATSNVLGLSVEWRYRFLKNHSITLEAAKSSYPSPAPLQGDNNSTKKWNFSGRNNEAYSIKLLSFFSATGTKLLGQFKKMGIHFQSFNVQSYNAHYIAWHIKADQYFFRKAWFISATVKTNEYNSPYTIYNYKSNTLFTSVQTTLRLKKWPVVSAVFMPSAQWYKTEDDILETRFNTLMASINYMYRLGGSYVNAALLFNQFFNDRGQRQFMYYNATNWQVNHSIMGERLTINSSAALSYNADYRLQMFDQGAILRFNKWLRAGGGIKWNRLNKVNNVGGYYGSAQLKLKQLGELEFSFDHGFLPGLKDKLLPNDMGRIIYIKAF